MRPPLRIIASQHPRMLQIDARAWLARLAGPDTKRIGLGQIGQREIAPIAELGIDLVWLTAAWTLGAQSRRLWRSSPWMQERRSELLPDGSDEDIAGWPFAIAAYEPAESLGGEAGLAALRLRLADAGIGLVLDFVPNHTAADHPWVRRHPERFVHAGAAERSAEPEAYFEVRSDGRHWIAHGRDPNFGPWRDTAQLDYRVAEVQRVMIKTLRDIATRCDGVVCSMAMLVLDDIFRATWASRSDQPSGSGGGPRLGDFWWHASTAVREVYPRFLLMGEAYWGLEWRLQQLGFDYTYDKPFFDRLVFDEPAAVAGHLRADDAYQRRSIRFLEDRYAPPGTPRLSGERYRAAMLTAATVPGMLLVRDGQLDGTAADVPPQLRRGPVESPDEATWEFNRRLLRATDDETFRIGQAMRIDPQQAWPGNVSNESLVVRLWIGQHRQLRLAVANLGPAQAQCYVPLPVPDFAGKEVHLEDLLTGVRYVRQGDDLLARGLYLDLPGYGRHLFRIVREQRGRRRRSAENRSQFAAREPDPGA